MRSSPLMQCLKNNSLTKINSILLYFIGIEELNINYNIFYSLQINIDIDYGATHK